MGGLIERSGIAERFYSALSGPRWARARRACGPDAASVRLPSEARFGSLAAGGTLGILIPPSIPLILYAALTEILLGRLFAGAAIPELIVTAIFSGYILAAGPRPDVVIMYLILGMFIDAISMMALTLGVVFPVVNQLGFDPVWFGITLVILLVIGLLTPPVGMNLFTIQVRRSVK